MKIKCPICGGEEFDNLKDWIRKPDILNVNLDATDYVFIQVSRRDSKAYVKREYDLLECKSCGFTMIMRRKDEEKVG